MTAPDVSAGGTVTATSGTISGNGAVTVAEHAPTVTTPAAAAPSLVTGTTTVLSVQGADIDPDAGNLVYTWAATTVPSGVSAQNFSFSSNGSNAAADTTATFSAAGTYVFTVTITDPGGQSATSNVSVTVNQTLTTIAVSPGTVSLDATATQQFTATACDQFGTALTSQPTFTWATTVGTITSAGGLLKAPDVSASGTVTATSGTISGNRAVTVTEHAPTVTTPAAASPSLVTGTTTMLSVQGADIDPDEGSLVYTWAATTVPNGVSVQSFSFSVNGSSAAENTTAAFTAAGVYDFTVTITDPRGLSATNSVNVTVNQTLTKVNTTGQPPVTTAFDQFGNPLANQPVYDAASDTISSTLALASNVTLLPTAGSELTISGGISGAGALDIDAAGTVVLTGTNTYTGGTTVAAGTLIATNASAIAANTSLVVGSSGIFIYDPSAATASSMADTASAVASAATTSDTSVATAAATSDTSAAATSSTADTVSAVAPTATTSDTSVATATPVAANVASASLASSAPTAAAVSVSASVATPAAAAVSNSAGESLLASSASVATPPLALPPAASPQAPSHVPAGGNVPLPTALSVAPTALNVAPPASAPAFLPSSQSVPASPSRSPAEERFAWSSITNRIAADPAWLGQTANNSDSSDSSDPNHKKDVAILALDAFFAQYGR